MLFLTEDYIHTRTRTRMYTYMFDYVYISSLQIYFLDNTFAVTKQSSQNKLLMARKRFYI